MKYYQQLDMTDCGAACLSMVASHYGRSLSIAEIRDVAGTDIIGTNINGLIIAAKSYGLVARAVKGSKQAITPQIPVPFIAHLHILRDKEDWVDHFVVVKNIGKKKIEIWDPDPLVKKKRITYEKFFESWTGYVLFFEPGECFAKGATKKICY